MATITLYKETVNGGGGLIDNLIKSSSNLDVQLGTLKNTLQGVDSSTCNLQDTVDSISSSPQSENSKIEDLKKLNISAQELLRKNEDLYTTLNQKDESSEEKLIEIMVQNPILIERPIIIKGDVAVIARPIENLEELLK